MRTSCLIEETRGDSFVEYTLLIGLFGMLAAGGFIALGVPLVKLFRYHEFVLALPIV